VRSLLFLGQKQFGEEAWERLRAREGQGYRIGAVCSNRSPDAVWWRSNSVYESRGDLPFVDNADRNEAELLEVIRANEIDTIICVQHPWVLSAAVLQAVGYNAINFHNAKLPEYRGYNAVNFAILNGDATYTCTAHWMVDVVDRGQIALEAEFPLTDTDTAIMLYARCHHAGLQLFDAVLERMADWSSMPRRPMAEGGKFYGRTSIETLRCIDDDADHETIKRRARAFYFPPFSPAYFVRDSRKYFVLPEEIMSFGFPSDSLKSLEQAVAATVSAPAATIR
jgi:methionyl-tRNA formyltransferase